MIRDLIEKNRSYRRFFEDEAIEESLLRELVDLARLSASAANLQPLKYKLVCEPRENAVVFEHLAWAGYLEGWDGPAEGKRPVAYIIILGDARMSRYLEFDGGIAAQSILLGAAEKGLGGCIIGSVQRDKLVSALGLPLDLKIVLVLALGRPSEEVVIETVGADGDIKYWRDDNSVHHVPKRPLDDIII